jgi:gamma-glutamyltranspeptidase
MWWPCTTIRVYSIRRRSSSPRNGAFTRAELLTSKTSRRYRSKGDDLTVFANQQTQFVPHQFSVKNKQVAKTLQRILESISAYDPKAEAMVAKTKYEGYSNTELDWLNLRDEIMRTIDMLYARYNDGKLSMIEYEDKKAELLSRL